MSVNTKMTAIANEIRTLSGTTDPMGLDAMATNLNGANVEVGDQSDLLDQAIAALAGKTAGDTNGMSVETCTVKMGPSVSNDDAGKPYCYTYTVFDDNHTITYKYVHENPMIYATLENVICGSIVSVAPYSNVYRNANATNAEMIINPIINSTTFFAFRITAPAGGIANIEFMQGNGSND